MSKYIPASSYCLSIFDGTHDTPQPVEKGFPLVTSKHIIGNKLNLEDTYCISEADYIAIQKRSKVSKWDVLFSMIGSVGEVYLEKNDDIPYAIKNIGVFSCADEYKAKWLYYYLKSPLAKRFINNYLSGAVQKFLPLGTLRSFPIIPFSEENKKIVDLLHVLDSKIEINNRINAELERLAKTLYDYWFVQFDFPNAEGKPYKTSGGKMVWNEELKREIPDGWECYELSKIVSRIGTGLNPRKNFVLGNGSNYYVTITNVEDWKICLDAKCDKIDDEALKKINKRSDLQVGDVLFTSIEPVGLTYLIQERPKNWNINESVFTLRPNYELVTAEYMFLLLSAKEIKVFTKNASAGSVHKGIRIGVLNTFKVAYGGKNLISNFSAIIRPVLKQLHTISTENHLLAGLRDWLLPMLMNGQVKVKDASSEE